MWYRKIAFTGRGLRVTPAITEVSKSVETGRLLIISDNLVVQCYLEGHHIEESCDPREPFYCPLSRPN